MKAVLVLLGIGFPKTHDIEALSSLFPPGNRPTISGEEQGILTEYATVARHPGWGTITLAEARRAVAVARRMRTEMRKMLPQETLKR